MVAKADRFGRHRKLHEDSREAIRNYYHLRYPDQVLFDEEKILASVPTKLRLHIKTDMFKDVLAVIPFLPEAPDTKTHSHVQHRELERIRSAFVRAIQTASYLPGENVVTEGSLGDMMFVIQRGQVEVIARGQSMAKLGRGTFFGGIAAMSAIKRTVPTPPPPPPPPPPCRQQSG
jgi:hyperpolarization activated cyclic nucleotide-gated potassium channel 2